MGWPAIAAIRAKSFYAGKIPVIVNPWSRNDFNC
jgi:hypothetical protein